MPSLPFLGSCEVCGKAIRNYRGLAGHLRHNQDQAHRELKQRWHAWRAEYRATLRCRKCGELFTIRDKSLKDRKRCPCCEGLRVSMSKRAYEALKFDKPDDPRQLMTAQNSKAQWDGLDTRSVSWVPGDEIYKAVVGLIESGCRVNDIRERLGISYKVLRAVGEHAFPDFHERMLERKVETMLDNIELARTDSQLEQVFTARLEQNGYEIAARNSWATLRISNRKVKREADIKVAVGDGRKVVVLCDGEAFHGPKAIYGDPQTRIDGDRETALAFFDLGYSVVRYSETEIHDGTALEHFKGLMDRLQSCNKVYRNWCPVEEQVA